MASRNVWKLKPKTNKNEQHKDFFVFGYACKIFRDDETAFHIDQGKHLIPWMGDENLLVDRYDGRGHLSDLRPYDAEFTTPYPIEKTATERAVEEQCERERYLELTVDIEEEKTREEEEWKRYYEAVNEGGFNAVTFNYDNQYDPSEPTDTEVIEDPALNIPYEIPPGLALPPEVVLPVTMKQHKIIEKTAKCVVEHGPQMEIMIKAKQSDHAQFDFLHYDHQLYPYYRSLSTAIKSGFYVPPVEVVEESPTKERHNSSYSSHDTDDDDDNTDTCLHPSLMVHKTQPKAPVVTLEGTAYGSLVQNLKDLLPKPPPPAPKPKAVTPPPEDTPDSPTTTDSPHSQDHDDSSEEEAIPPEEKPPNPVVTELRKESTKKRRSRSSTPVGKKKKAKSPPPEKETEVMHGPMITPPPPDLQPIIDRMAQYVVKNGEDFETVVKSKKDPRFTFIIHGDIHHPYYEFKKNFFFEEKQKYEEEQRLSTTRSISFSLKPKAKEPEPVVVETETKLKFAEESSEEEENDETGEKTKSSINDNGEKLPDDKKPPDDKKNAEEKIRDRLAAAARIKHATVTKDKHLQLERKKRAAMFVNMLKTTPPPPVSTDVPATEAPLPPTNDHHPTRSPTPHSVPHSPSPTPQRDISPVAVRRSVSPLKFDYDHIQSAPRRSLTLPSAYRSTGPSPSTPISIVKSTVSRPLDRNNKKPKLSKRSRSRSPSSKKSKSSKHDKHDKVRYKSKKHKKKKIKSDSNSDSDDISESHDKLRERLLAMSRAEVSVDSSPSATRSGTASPPTLNIDQRTHAIWPPTIEEAPPPEDPTVPQDTHINMSDVQICQFRARVKARRQAIWDEKKANDVTYPSAFPT